MNISDETLHAYVDDELGEAERARVSQAIAADPELARRVAAQQALRGRLRAAFDPVLSEPVPAHLLALTKTPRSVSPPGNVVPLRRPKAANGRPWVQWGSLAASFVLGALLWHYAGPDGAPIAAGQRGLTASGYLSRALSSRLAGEQSGASAVQIGVSFRSKQGEYCRTFQLHAGDAGLACYDKDQWAIQIMAHTEPASAATSSYRQAASSLPAAVLQAVDESMAGDALDAAAEAQARAQGWRAHP